MSAKFFLHFHLDNDEYYELEISEEAFNDLKGARGLRQLVLEVFEDGEIRCSDPIFEHLPNPSELCGTVLRRKKT